MIAKIKLYSYDNNNYETFRGSFSREIVVTKPQAGMTVIIPSEPIRDKNFRFYITHLVFDLRNRPSKQTIIIDKRRFHWRTAGENIYEIKQQLIDQGWNRHESGTTFLKLEN